MIQSLNRQESNAHMYNITSVVILIIIFFSLKQLIPSIEMSTLNPTLLLFKNLGLLFAGSDFILRFIKEEIA